jgi:ERCC4-related helicase
MFFFVRERRDVNRVSLVLCIDPHKNDAKMIQKKGKTGRFLAISRHYLTTPERSFLRDWTKKTAPGLEAVSPK